MVKHIKSPVKIIGGGLAGVEAAWQLLKKDIPVIMYEMRPHKMTPAHTGGDLAELVCSNSLRAAGTTNAVGLLKAEMRLLGSLVMEAAEATAVPAGGALAVDRKKFSAYIEEKLTSNPNFTLIREEITELPQDELCIIASGPLTSDKLAAQIQELAGEGLYFHDAIAPIVSYESLDMQKCFWQSRYDKGDGTDYLNCPMTKDEYDAFYHALITAELAPLRDFEGEGEGKEKTFEGCLPIEVLAKRGEHTMRYGPLKPVGLRDKDGNEPYAVVQLRRENNEGTMFNLVGFQTRLKWGEQKRVFSMIPGLENAEFLRLGAMHRNTYINSPKILSADLRLKERANLFFAGQITGVEGYVESSACGIAAGLNAARFYEEKETVIFPQQTALGGLLYYICNCPTAFQPMNVTFGLLPPPEQRFRGKQLKNEYLAKRALDAMQSFIEEL